MKYNIRFLCILLLLTISTSSTLSGRQQSGAPGTLATISLTELHTKILVLRQELEEVRIAMGRPRIDKAPFEVTGTALYELAFQARTLCEKTSLLCDDLTHEYEVTPELPKGAINPVHIRDFIAFAAGRVERIKVRLNIEPSSRLKPLAPKENPDVLLMEIVAANRQLNLLLERPYSPADVYQEVSEGIAHASQLLARFPDVVRIPEAPPYEPRKFPVDVYQRLIRCLEMTKEIALRLNPEMRRLRLKVDTGDDILPSDVYDIATLVVAELAEMNRRLRHPPRMRRGFYPGNKIPADVYQRAGILTAQLIALKRLSRTNPDRLHPLTVD